MPGADLRGLPPWLLRAPHGERLQGARGPRGGVGRQGWAGRDRARGSGVEVLTDGRTGPQEAVQLDAEVFTALIRRLLPRVHKHLQQVGVGPLLYLPEWFLCLFARSLPFPTVLRVWDAFLSEGE